MPNKLLFHMYINRRTSEVDVNAVKKPTQKEQLFAKWGRRRKPNAQPMTTPKIKTSRICVFLFISICKSLCKSIKLPDY